MRPWPLVAWLTTTVFVSLPVLAGVVGDFGGDGGAGLAAREDERSASSPVGQGFIRTHTIEDVGLSTLTLTTFSRPARSVAACSISGLTVRHGPHQGAQRSMRTSTGACVTAAKVLGLEVRKGPSGADTPEQPISVYPYWYVYHTPMGITGARVPADHYFARLGRFGANRRRLVMLVWLVAVLAAAPLAITLTGGAVGCGVGGSGFDRPAGA